MSYYWCVFSGEPQTAGHLYSAVNGSSPYVDGFISTEQPARVKQQMWATLIMFIKYLLYP